MQHTFFVPIYPPLQHPKNLKDSLELTFRDDGNEVKKDDLLAVLDKNLYVKSPFDGKFVRLIEDFSKIDYITKLGELKTVADLNDHATILEIFIETKLKTNIALPTFEEQLEQYFPKYCKMGVAPGYEHFEQVVDVWIMFLNESKVPKKYLTYEYFRSVCENVFKIKDRPGITFAREIKSEYELEVVTDFNFELEQHKQTFISKAS